MPKTRTASSAFLLGETRSYTSDVKVEPGTVVTLTYDLCTEGGEIIESSDISGPVTFMHGKSSILPGLDAKLNGMEEGADGTFEFAPEEAFGRVEDSPTTGMPKAEFPKGVALEKGSKFEAKMGGGQAIQLEVVDVGETEVTVRMIHPLAGQKLSMSLKVVGVRAATSKETEEGRAIVAPPAPPPKK